MKTFSLKSVLSNLYVVVGRFPITILLLLGCAVLSWLEINQWLSDYYIPAQLIFFCSIGTIVGITAMLGVENLRFQQWTKHGLTLACVLLWGVYCLFLPDEKQMHFDSGLQIFILGAVFVVSAFFISFLKNNQDAAFWGFSRDAAAQFCESAIFGAIIFAGLSVALLSVGSLFGIAVPGRYYANLAVFCFVLFAPGYFLTNIPDKTKKYHADLSFSQALKVLGLYILLPILGLYIAILYTYLIKIIAVWELPNGWVSALVSILAIGGLLVMLIMYPVWRRQDDKVVNFFYRYFGLLIFPLLVLMTVGIFRRIADYGISINRCYILLLNVWFYGIFLYLFLTKTKHIKWIIISPTVLLLLVSIGPWRVSNITKHIIFNDLETTLQQMPDLKSGKLSRTTSKAYISRLDKASKARIHDPLKYLADNYGVASIQPFFVENLNDGYTFVILNDLGLNFNSTKDIDSKHFTITVSDIAPGITGYRYFVELLSADNNENKYITVNATPHNRAFSIPIQKSVLKLVKTLPPNAQYKQVPFSTQNRDIVITGSNYSLYIKDIEGSYYSQNDSISVSYFRGFLFYK
ncbi:hypothetical protein AGMMS49982_13240 [Bacteroidia bacterium]|nr:hypothetical protein AGMMS49982_13240 [Bacteroidia bacterium]